MMEKFRQEVSSALSLNNNSDKICLQFMIDMTARSQSGRHILAAATAHLRSNISSHRRGRQEIICECDCCG